MNPLIFVATCVAVNTIASLLIDLISSSNRNGKKSIRVTVTMSVYLGAKRNHNPFH